MLQALAFPYFSEAWVDHTVLANETQAEGFWESVCCPNACTISFSSFRFPPDWNVNVGLEVQQSRWDHEVISLRMKATVLRMVKQKDGYSYGERP